MKVLFQLENDPSADRTAILDYQASELDATPDVIQFASVLVDGVQSHREEIDQLITEASENWKLDQMAKVDRTILRIAVYELTVERNVPAKAAINESIELAKTFSGDEAGRFVNGVLGRVASMASP